ncbi:hypothetical protein RSOLAG1IB_00752 [Rhizoctonia solani AG-1 IB]|uniref:Uncharacterized protein n=1 Tax=Thanatephorus cucumeris (strain AG1-IB / isolate 7/3/14) TaxID=1108050 RepID=A0A0B7F7N0_THACB|nr:hypothetical protein RSOLAG1IB_00752 [Rhizoctonia solani AG-1 IB]
MIDYCSYVSPNLNHKDCHVMIVTFTSAMAKSAAVIVVEPKWRCVTILPLVLLNPHGVSPSKPNQVHESRVSQIQADPLRLLRLGTIT